MMPVAGSIANKFLAIKRGGQAIRRPVIYLHFFVDLADCKL
jgi:hypothetical protein